MNATLDRTWVSQVEAVATMVPGVEVDVRTEARLCDCTDGRHQRAAEDDPSHDFAWTRNVDELYRVARYYAGSISHPITRTVVTLTEVTP